LRTKEKVRKRNLEKFKKIWRNSKKSGRKSSDSPALLVRLDLFGLDSLRRLCGRANAAQLLVRQLLRFGVLLVVLILRSRNRPRGWSRVQSTKNAKKKEKGKKKKHFFFFFFPRPHCSRELQNERGEERNKTHHKVRIRVPSVVVSGRRRLQSARVSQASGSGSVWRVRRMHQLRDACSLFSLSGLLGESSLTLSSSLI
jgi:hypothetical protein